ncbi:hypothetical protein [Brachyspira pilosicoli]|uniref:hypothetical protein n=1 Tax=Brachyspira pilosicoli TaxID=52584 RepID=UPI0030041DE3
MVETFIYIIMSILLFIMFSIAWKNLLKSLCRRYLIIQKINFINNNKKEYVKYMNILIKDSYSFSIYEHIVDILVSRKRGLLSDNDIEESEKDVLIYDIVSIYLLFMTLSSIVFSILIILLLIIIFIFSICSMVFKNSIKLFNIVRNINLYSKLYIINNMNH